MNSNIGSVNDKVCFKFKITHSTNMDYCKEKQKQNPSHGYERFQECWGENKKVLSYKL
jgi:hypothetical protein